jgi:hypothetical protein
MGLPVFAQYCDNFCVSIDVRFTVSRLTAHFLLTIYFLYYPITLVTENYTFVSKPLLVWLLAYLIQSILKQLAFLLVLLMGSFTGTHIWGSGSFGLTLLTGVGLWCAIGCWWCRSK